MALGLLYKSVRGLKGVLMNLSKGSLAIAKRNRAAEKQEQVFLIMVFVVPALMIFFG